MRGRAKIWLSPIVDMTFQALAKLNADYSTSKGDFETVVWRPSVHSTEDSDKSITVVVEEDIEPLDPVDVVKDPAAPSPIVVYVSKSDVPTMVFQRSEPNHIERGGVTYRVAGSMSQDPGAWELYCVR